jgi:hypothetical protein
MKEMQLIRRRLAQPGLKSKSLCRVSMKALIGGLVTPQIATSYRTSILPHNGQSLKPPPPRIKEKKGKGKKKKKKRK